VETLEAQYKIVRSKTTKSHVMQYSDLTFTSELAGDFFGKGAGVHQTDAIDQNAVSVRDLDLHQFKEDYRRAETSLQRSAAEKALQAELARRQAAEATFRRIAELAYPGDVAKQQAVRHLQETPQSIDCEKGAHMVLRKSCAHKFDASSGFAMQFQQVIVNICADVRRGLNLDVLGFAEQACTVEEQEWQLVV